MLKPAQLYKEKLRTELINSWYKPENIYWEGWTGSEVPDIPDNNYNNHYFVSVDKEDNVIGYISYAANWIPMSVDRLGIISFRKGNIEFAKDVYECVCNIFEVYHMNRIQWCCYTDNPAIRGYRNFIKRHGGRECGYYRQVARLRDGKMHDSVQFEILADEFKK